jgi:hypothetical protein
MVPPEQGALTMSNNDQNNQIPYLLIPAIQGLDKDGYLSLDLQWAPTENAFSIAKKKCHYHTATTAGRFSVGGKVWDIFCDDEGLLKPVIFVNDTVSSLVGNGATIVGDCFAMQAPEWDADSEDEVYPPFEPADLMTLGRAIRSIIKQPVCVTNRNDPRRAIGKPVIEEITASG